MKDIINEYLETLLEVLTINIFVVSFISIVNKVLTL